MDIKELKSEVRKYIAAMKKDGKDISFAALIPVYPWLEDTSYVLQVSADWIENMSFKEVIDYMIPKMFEVLDERTRLFINRVDTFDEKGDVFCESKDLILINKIYYNPTNHYNPPQYVHY
jgi:hypothetical protein